MDAARNYSREKYTLSLIETGYIFVILLLFAASGLSQSISVSILLCCHQFLLIPLYLLTVYILYYALNFPLNFYHSFVLEHKYNLSSQKIGDWLLDQLKSGLISYLILLILFEAFYVLLKISPQAWWLAVSIFWIFFNLILARLAPVIIIPLFFKYKKLSDQGLRERIIHLAEKMNLKILDVFEIDFSKKTLKANAAFVGWGRTRRVILADTLKDKYSHDEIAVILAHEFAHYKLKHLIKLILINSAATILAFYFIYKTSSSVLSFFNLSSLSDVAAFPVVCLYFVLFGIIMQPLSNFISRIMERHADKMALEVTGSKEAFVSMMDKLAQQNLADRSPHPLIKFFFFDHPPINERIQMAKNS